jgi:hypothetical protein
VTAIWNRAITRAANENELNDHSNINSYAYNYSTSKEGSVPGQPFALILDHSFFLLFAHTLLFTRYIYFRIGHCSRETTERKGRRKGQR